MNDNFPLVVANFKANQTWDDLQFWLEKVSPQAASFTGTVIVCPSAPFLSEASQKIKSANWPIKLGAQDISKFEQGAYTGEFVASQVAGLVNYAIIGHSERRSNFKEDNETLSLKVENTQKAGIIPIYCVEDSEIKIPESVKIVAYEPTFAIGTGNPDTPENAQNVAKEIKNKGDHTVIYGGSVTAANCNNFLSKGLIDGLLIGSASLDPNGFANILKSATF